MTAGDVGRLLGGRRLATLVTFCLFASVLALTPSLVSSPPAEAAVATDEITITPTGLDPAEVIVEPGTTVLFRNDTVAPNSVTSTDGIVDSGPIPPGGGFAVAFPAAGIVDVVDANGNPGSIAVGTTTLDGPADALAVSVVPDTRFPPFTPDELAVDPDTAIVISRRRLIVGLDPTATVAEVDAALAAAGTPLIGGIAWPGLLLVANPEDDLGSLAAAADALEASPAIRYAVPDGPPAGTALPEEPLKDFDEGIPPDRGVSPPFPPNPDGWYWNPSTAAVGVDYVGQGANWALENVRAPQVWNLREAIEDFEADVVAGVVDADIGDGHPELPLLEQAVHCTSLLLRLDCVDDKPGSHGTHVSGVVSSTWGHPEDHLTAGRPSLDNGSRVIGLPWGTTDGIDGLGYSHSLVDLQSRMVELAEAGEPIRVINQSAGFALDASWWATSRRTKTCGPLPAGDDATGTLPCVPSNDDLYMQTIAEWSEPLREIVQDGATREILYVAAATNDAAKWCWTGTQLFRQPPNTNSTDAAGDPRTPDPAPPSGCSRAAVPLNGAIAGSHLNYLAANWTGPGPSPIIVVESIGRPFAAFTDNFESFDRSPFSQVGGDVSAPGANIYSSCRQVDTTQDALTSDPDPFHCTMNGTSMASPMVASLALTVSRHSSEPTMTEVRDAIMNWIVPKATGGASPYIDAFSSLLSLPGAAYELVDVNDHSADGNRRVESDGTADVTFDPADPDDRTAPDGIIDLRDFRRFRDAWLQLCGTTAADASCPAVPLLDGEQDHLKRDLNFDGCPGFGVTTCRHPEGLYPRFDFNGDGRMSRYALMPMPFDEEGFLLESRPASVADQPWLSDLDVLESQFFPTEPDDWTRDDLDDLMISGDLTIDAQSLYDFGASGVTIDVTHPQTLDGAGNPRELSYTLAPDPSDPAASEKVVTVLADQPVELTITATFPAPVGEVTVVDQTLTLSPGEDHFVNACGIDLEVAPPVVAPGAVADLTATISGCGPDAIVEGLAVALTLTPSDANGAVLADDAPLTNAAGVATTTIETGTILQGYTISASATLVDSQGSPVIVEGETTFRVDAAYEMEVIDFTRVDGPTALGSGPGIGADGTVAWEVVDATGDELWFDEGLGHQAVPGSRIDDDPDPNVGQGWFYTVSVSDDGALWALNEQVEPITVGTGGVQRRREIHRFGLPSGTSERIVKGHAHLLDPRDADADHYQIGLPAPNDAGGVVYPAWPFDDPGVLYRLAMPGEPDGLVGPAVLTVPLEATEALQPVHADNGATAVNALLSAGDPVAAANAIVVGPDVLGIDDTFDGFVLAYDPLDDDAVTDPSAPAYFADEKTRFVALGDQVAMTQDGRVIAFLGDKGDGWGLYLYLRPDPTAAAFEGPLLVIGGHDVNPAPDLGFDSNGDPIVFATWETDDRIGIHLNEAGAPGLDDDHVILTYAATPSADGDGFTNWTGLFTSEVGLESTSGGTVLHPHRPVAAVQVNDRVDATTRVADIGIWDPIDSGPTSDPADHRLVWWQALDDGEQQIIRATRITADAAASGETVQVLAPSTDSDGDALTGTFGAALSPPAQLLPPEDPPAATGPVVPAMAIEDLTPVAGENVRFTNRSRTTEGVSFSARITTSDGGSAIDVFPDGFVSISPATDGPWTVTMTVDGGTTSLAASVELTVDPPPNRLPEVVTDGPWIIPDGGRVVLDASASSDPDPGDSIAAFDWDFDGDFDFGEFSGPIVDLAVAEFEALACVTSCERNVQLPIRIRVTDSNGVFEFGGDFVTLSSDPADFTLQIDPASQFMNPGARTDLLVKVNGLGGFSDPVDLAVEPLPTDWSATIEPTTVTPDGTALLSVWPAEGAVEGDVAIQVTGTSGELTHTTGSTASVTFALIPVCTATITGQLTDADTGRPLTTADRVDVFADDDRSFWAATVEPDADGRFTINEVPITTRLFLRARGFVDSEYWGTDDILLQTVCDATLEADFELEAKQYGMVVGRITEAVADPTDTTASRDLYSSGIPVEGIRARAAGFYDDISAADGTFSIEDIPLKSQNAPRSISVFGGQEGYWGTSKSVEIREGAVIDVGDLPILERCSSSITATGQVFDTDGDPIQTGVRLGFGQTMLTEPDGTFSIGPVEQPLGQNNSAVEVTLRANALFFGGFGDSVQIPVPDCDLDIVEDHVLVVEAEPPPPPPDNYAVLEGRVVDERTGAGVGGARVYLHRFSLPIDSERADADGFYRFDDIFVGVGDDTTDDSYFVSAPTNNNYWGSEPSPKVTLDSTTPTVIDIEMEPIDKATVTGVVVDSATDEPIEWASVGVSAVIGSGGSSANTGPDGRFEITDLIPGEGNVPIVAEGFANKNFATIGTPGLWYTDFFDVVLQPGGTTDVRIELLQVCTDVSINGLVINAETLLPEPDVRVTGGGVVDFTGEDGTFLLEGVELDEGNEPATVTVTASKSGFITLRKNVTVFCGANVRVDFGNPDVGTGSITGTVTDADTGLPIEGAFIGSEFGGRDTTDIDGRYLLSDAPVAFDGSPRDWEIDVLGPRDATAEAIVTVAADTETVQDFQLSVPANRAPTADAQAVETAPEDPVGITLTGSDPDGDPLTFTIQDPPSGGSLAGAGSAQVYTPSAGTKADSFTFTVFDGELTSEPVTVDITVTEPGTPGRPPTAVDDAETTDEGVAVTSDVAANDGDLDGDLDPATVAVVTPPLDGEADSNGDGTVTYTPDAGFFGTDTYTYEICDATGLCDTATVTVTVEQTVIAPPDLVIGVSDVVDPVAPGESLTYVIGYRNDGGDATGVTVAAVVPTQSTFDATASTPGWVCDPDDRDGAVCTIDIGALSGGGSGTMAFSSVLDATVGAGLDEGATVASITDDGSHGADAVPADNLAAETTIVQAAPDLGLSKSDDGESRPGATIAYTLVYANTGNQDASGVVIEERLPDHTTFDAGASSPGWVCAADGSCSFAVDDVPAGTSDSVEFAAAVDQTVPAEVSEIVNTAAIGDDRTNGADPNPDDNTATLSTSVNRPPVADAGGPYAVDEGSTVVLDAGGSLDPEGGALSLEWDLDADGEFDDAEGATVSYLAVDGPASPTVAVRATDPAGLTDIAVAVVEVANVAPEVGALPTVQQVQYSDAIAPLTVSATDVAADTPDDITVTHAVDGGGVVAGLPAGLALNSQGCVVPAGSACGWSVTGAADTAPGEYTIRFDVADEDGGVGSAEVSISVVVEDAAVDFDDANPLTVGVSAAGDDSVPFSLVVDVAEVDVPDDALGDRNLAGDIRSASVDVALVPIGPGSTVLPTSPCSRATRAGLVDPESSHDYEDLVLSCGFDDVAVNTYVVQVDVGGRYSASGQSVVTVSDPSLGFTTGGGWFHWPGTDDKTNFGFTVRHNEKGTNVRGNLLMIRHLGEEGRYRVKSNRLDALAMGTFDDTGWATFSGKSTYMEPGWDDAEGNHSFVVYVEDHAEPGRGADRIWIAVRDKAGEFTTLSLPTSSLDHAEVIDGGNIVVPHTNNGGGGR